MDAIHSKALIAIVSEIITDSSDTDDDEFMEITISLIPDTEQKRNVPKIKNYLEIVPQYSDKQFKDNFRLSRTTANHLIDLYRESSFFASNQQGGSKVIPADNQMLSFLWFAGNKCCIRDVSGRFGIGQTTFHRQCLKIMEFLVELAPRVIKFPKTENEKIQTANEFERLLGFPNVVGCIDGTAISIRTPAHKIKSTYVNRHDLPSITLQGICDATKKFTDVFVGPPGKIHDSRVYNMSFISKEIPSICDQRFHLLGDSAYAVREYLLTPYRNYGNLSIAQAIFNRKHCGTRVSIENAFGWLKGRFRQLTCLDFHSVDKSTKFILACCVLHNLCIDNNDILNLEDMDLQNDEDINQNIENTRETHLRLLGELKRDELSQKFDV